MPQLWPECEFYIRAFYELNFSRQVAMGGIGYIPIVEILAWAAINECEDVRTLLSHIRALDLAYVQEWNARQDRERERRRHER